MTTRKSSASPSDPEQEAKDRAVIEKYLERLRGLAQAYLPPEDWEVIVQAYELAVQLHAPQRRETGEPYVTHVIEVASILAEKQMSRDVLCAALLHDTIEDRNRYLYQKLANQFGTTVADLVRGVTNLSKSGRPAQAATQKGWQLSNLNLKRLLTATSDDLRVLLIKLADRLHNMRTLEYKKEDSRRRKAQETLFFYAPIAARLGIWQFKTELETHCFAALRPAEYRAVVIHLAQVRQQQLAQFAEIEAALSADLARVGLQARLEWLPPNPYSIYQLSRKQGRPVTQIPLPLIFCIIVPTQADCFTAVTSVHERWRYIPSKFDDYINNPKAYYYRSVHTTVIGPAGQILKVRIRTEEMHARAEFGAFTDPRFKNGAVSATAPAKPRRKQYPLNRKKTHQPQHGFESQIGYWTRLAANPEEFAASLVNNILADRLHVYTPKGDSVELPAQATALDAAYAIHSSLGHSCRAVRINGMLMPLHTPLQDGDAIEILTVEGCGPRYSWLDPHLGLTRTALAKDDIRRWFRRRPWEERLERGRAIFEEELRMLGMPEYALSKAARLMGLNAAQASPEEALLEALGIVQVSGAQLAEKILEKEFHFKQKISLPQHLAPPNTEVYGTGAYPPHLAECCQPKSGDPIIGLLRMASNGAPEANAVAMIHHPDCKIALSELDQHRVLRCTWEPGAHTFIPARIDIWAVERAGVLRDISIILFRGHVNILNMQANADEEEGYGRISALVEIETAQQLVALLHQINQVPNVLRVQRAATES